MEHLNNTFCNHFAKGLALLPSAIEIAASTFAASVLLLCHHF